jgi:putative transposase
MHAGADWRHAGGQEGTTRLSGRRSGERAELARVAGRLESTRPVHCARSATGDGALGFWKALDEVSPTTRHQRCTVHKTANVLDKLPKSVQPTVKSDLREIWKAPDRATAEAAIATFTTKYGAKYNKAVTCLVKDRDALLTFYDFPAEHWDHLRTSNPIESVFATVRHRTVRTKGALSQDTARLMVFKLVTAAAKTWRRLKGENQLPKVVQGVTFTNGVEVTNTPAQNAA